MSVFTVSSLTSLCYLRCLCLCCHCLCCVYLCCVYLYCVYLCCVYLCCVYLYCVYLCQCLSVLRLSVLCLSILCLSVLCLSVLCLSVPVSICAVSICAVSAFIVSSCADMIVHQADLPLTAADRICACGLLAGLSLVCGVPLHGSCKELIRWVPGSTEHLVCVGSQIAQLAAESEEPTRCLLCCCSPIQL